MTDPVPPSLLQDLSTALAGIVGDAAGCVVAVHSHRSRSSGFIWRPGFVVTADEALAEEGDIAVTLPGGETRPAKLVGRDPSTDIALLRIDRTDLTPAPLGAGGVVTGALAVVVGAEEGGPTAALGVVSRSAGPWRSLRGGEIDARLELDMTLLRAAEGGLAIDAAGQAFGMAVFGPRRRVLVIPSATIERVASRLESHGRIGRGYLGLSLQPVAVVVEGGGGAGIGAMVMSVDADGPGAAAGVRQGDVIVAWNGEPIRRLQSLLRALGPDSVGRTVTLGLRRAGEPVDVTLTIGERPGA
jgi:S1-C subfamily serine protease